MSWIFAYVFVVFCRHVAMLNKLMMMMMIGHGVTRQQLGAAARLQLADRCTVCRLSTQYELIPHREGVRWRQNDSQTI